ncbi:hypothetical protein TWF718_009340 [Orbilia javanica]|uniref:Uncharacterized protein n=1 Tax=Orbilia javanica TaxID=47235 RepID=A0AAN8RBR5_9PEZI
MDNKELPPTKATEAGASETAEEGTEAAGVVAPGDQEAVLKALRNTAEAMAEYLDCLDKLSTVGEISARLVTYYHPAQISHNEMAKYYGALETHIIPFLKKYGYEELGKAVDESYNNFVDNVAGYINFPAEGTQMRSDSYLELVTTIDRVLTKIIEDFGDNEDNEGVVPDLAGVQDGGGAEEGVGAPKAGGEEGKDKKENRMALDMEKLSLDTTPAQKKNQD